MSVESKSLQGLSWREGLETKGICVFKYFTSGIEFLSLSYPYIAGIQEQCVL